MKKPKGRKTLLTSAVRRRILSLLERGHTIRDVALASGFSERVFFNWCESDPSFSAETQRARAAGRIQIVERILRDRDWRALSWFLSVTDPQSYGRTAERAVPHDPATPPAPIECEIIVRSIPETHRQEVDEELHKGAPGQPQLAIVRAPQVPKGVFEFKRSP